MVSWELGVGEPIGKPASGKPGAAPKETARKKAPGKVLGAGEGVTDGKPGAPEKQVDRTAKDDAPWPVEEGMAA